MPRLIPNRFQLLTLMLAFIAACILYQLGAPLPFLFGPIGACLVAAVLGVPLQGMPLMSTLCRTILGVAIGASITWSVMHQLVSLAPTLLLVPIYVIIIAAFGVNYFHRLVGYDKVTAYYAAMPGGLQDMVVFGEEAGANPRTLSLIHATRLLLLVTLAPIMLITFFDADLSNPLGPPAKDLPLYHAGLILLIGVCGWKIASKIGIFGATVIGPMLLAIPLSLSGFLTQRPSQEVIMVAQLFIGIGIGVYYRGITLTEIRRDILAASGFSLLLLLIAVIFTTIATLISVVEPTEMFLAFWPAGQAEIAVLSLAAGAQVGIVVTHHVVRIVFVILGAPMMARYVSNKDPDNQNQE